MFSTISKANFNFRVTFILSSANALNLDLSKVLLFGKELTQHQMTNFKLFQTERVCRRQFQIRRNGRKLSKRVENTVGKGEVFSKGLFPRGVKRCHCVGIG